jgi:hypothetical protein
MGGDIFSLASVAIAFFAVAVATWQVRSSARSARIPYLSCLKCGGSSVRANFGPASII